MDHRVQANASLGSREVITEVARSPRMRGFMNRRGEQKRHHIQDELAD